MSTAPYSTRSLLFVSLIQRRQRSPNLILLIGLVAHADRSLPPPCFGTTFFSCVDTDWREE